MIIYHEVTDARHIKKNIHIQYSYNILYRM